MNGAFPSTSMWKSVQWSPASSVPTVRAKKPIIGQGARPTTPPAARMAAIARPAVTAAPAPTITTTARKTR